MALVVSMARGDRAHTAGPSTRRPGVPPLACRLSRAARRRRAWPALLSREAARVQLGERYCSWDGWRDGPFRCWPRRPSSRTTQRLPTGACRAPGLRSMGGMRGAPGVRALYEFGRSRPSPFLATHSCRFLSSFPSVPLFVAVARVLASCSHRRPRRPVRPCRPCRRPTGARGRLPHACRPAQGGPARTLPVPRPLWVLHG